MTPQVVKEHIIKVLKSIQSDSGYADESITGSTCPLQDLQGFDSKVWPYSIGELATEMGLDIPNNANIYISKDGKRKLTIDESAIRVYEIIDKQARKQ